MSSKATKIVRVSAQHVGAHAEQYNTSFHKEHEAPEHIVPSEEPQRFGRWLPLIARSQGIGDSEIQTVTLTRSQGKLLYAASDSTIHTHILNRIYVEELEEDIIPAFSHLTFPPEGLFLRFDSCSPKDGANGTKPLRNLADIILRITSSYRARNAIAAILEGFEHGTIPPKTGIKLYFLPFNTNMATNHEYRIFCAPPNGKISTVSQYKWHAPSSIAASHLEDTVYNIMANIRRIHSLILQELGTEEMDGLLLAQGFSFDVLWQEGSQTCCLIELNGFGVRGACGACLFNWVRDFDVMYGRTGYVEFRVSLDEWGVSETINT